MDMSKLTRNAAKVHAAITDTGDSVIAKQPCKMYIPVRYKDCKLISMGNEIFVTGLYLLVVDEFYAVDVTCSMLRISPSSIETVTINDVEHYEFTFEKGDAVIASTDVAQNGKLLYYIYEELVGKGNIPVYFDYLDVIRLFKTAKSHGGTTLTSTPTILHMLLSVICRDKKDPMTYFRQVTNGKDFDTAFYVPLKSPIFGATNTPSRLLGAYYGDSLTAALVNPAVEEEQVERILRM